MIWATWKTSAATIPITPLSPSGPGTNSTIWTSTASRTSYPDWTHTNAVLYSPSDGNLIISIRHQNWLVKIDYNNGIGTGNIIWHLGYQGDFTLLNADGSTDTNPFDWFYAQHGPNFTTTNTSGQFSLVLFDNGDDRGVSVVAGEPAACRTCPLATAPFLS